DVGMAAQQGRLARFRDPRDARGRRLALQRGGNGHRVDDVTDGGELDERDVRAHRAPPPPKRSTIVLMRSRVACCFGSPVIAVVAPSARVVVRSGTDSAL